MIVTANSVAMLDRRDIAFPTTNSVDNTLTMVDLTTRNIRWQATGQFTAHPAANANLVFVGNDRTQQMEARDVTTGNLAWSWALDRTQDNDFLGNIIVTNNLLFVSSTRKTYAIDLNTHQTVWSYPLSGQLALSAQGVLYILYQKSQILTPVFNRAKLPNDSVAAINLK